MKRKKHRTHSPGDRRIKVHVFVPGGPHEYLWAQRIGSDTAQIRNIPFSYMGVNRGSLVRINSQLDVIKVLERAGRARPVQFASADSTEAETRERAMILEEELHKYDIFAEFNRTGFCSLSVPDDINDDRLEKILEGCGAQLLYRDSDEN